MHMLSSFAAFATVFLAVLPAVASQGQVAVLPVTYEVGRTGVQSQKDIDAIWTIIKHAVKEADMSVVDQDRVQRVLASLEGSRPGSCRDAECLETLIARLGAANALAVSVVDKEARFELTVAYARGKTLTANVFGNKERLRDDIYGNIASVLQQTRAPDTGGEERAGPTPKPRARGNKLDPLPFYLSAGITSALALSWTAVEITGYARSRDIDGKATPKQIEGLKTLRIVDGVLLGTAAAGAITTAILFFLTDFDNRNKKDKTRAKFSVTPTWGGGMMGIEGWF